MSLAQIRQLLFLVISKASFPFQTLHSDACEKLNVQLERLLEDLTLRLRQHLNTTTRRLADLTSRVTDKHKAQVRQAAKQ